MLLHIQHTWRKRDMGWLLLIILLTANVHTSKVIWALKTIKKHEWMPFTDEKRHSYVEQQLPLLTIENWKTPVTEQGGVGAVKHQASLKRSTALREIPSRGALTDEAIRGREDTLLQATPHNLAFKIERFETILTNSSKTRPYSKRTRGSLNIWHCSQNYSHK